MNLELCKLIMSQGFNTKTLQDIKKLIEEVPMSTFSVRIKTTTLRFTLQSKTKNVACVELLLKHHQK